jgi:toxin-antitoxin system PIN domain toxin
MFVVDTNILLYAVNPDSPDHKLARDAVLEWRSASRTCFLTWSIVYEFLRVSTHPNVFPAPLTLAQAHHWIEAFTSPEHVEMLVASERHAETMAEVCALHPRVTGNALHDLHIAVLMKEHGVAEIRTADSDFHQFKFLKVVNPLLR